MSASADERPRTPAEWFKFFVFWADLEARGLPQTEHEARQRLDQCLRWAGHWWPLVRAKVEGIERGQQWDELGRLACRYARDLCVTELAGELWAVTEVSPQNHHDPWTRGHVVDIAARAHRFIEGADAAQDRLFRESGAYAWASGLTREAATQGRSRQQRRPGARRPGARRG